MAQFVDIDALKEFMKEALAKITPAELNQIMADLEGKSAVFQQKLGKTHIGELSGDEFYDLLRMIFSTRRKAREITQTHPVDDLKMWVSDLLYGPADIPERLEEFCHHFPELEENVRYDMATEFLHFSQPDRFWLWSRWIWDPKTKTGALPLVITEDYELEAASIGEAYVKIGKAIAFVRHVGEAAGISVISSGRFGVDAYLCSVYVVYVYTVLRMRMTQEFNQVMPGLAEFCRRLLGIYGK